MGRHVRGVVCNCMYPNPGLFSLAVLVCLGRCNQIDEHDGERLLCNNRCDIHGQGNVEVYRYDDSPVVDWCRDVNS